MTAWTPTRTRQGDTLALLIQIYKVSLDDILEMNGLTPRSKYTNAYVSSRVRDLGINPAQYTATVLKKIIMENDINEWVHSVGGDCMKFLAGSTTENRKLAGCATGGYAVFTNDTQIMLPDVPRPGVPSRDAKPGEGAPGAQVPAIVKAPVKTGWGWWLVGGLAVAGGLFVTTRSKRRGRAATVP